VSEALTAYRLRKSERARRVRLRVTVEHGLEVVIPARFDAARVPALLQQRRRWIHAALERAEATRALLGYTGAWKLPAAIVLPALGRTWRMAASPAETAVRVRAHGDELRVTGAIHDEPACRAALTRWLVCQARQHLSVRLQVLSDRLQLPYRRVSVRRQRTRWGSCSPTKSISLNARLLFLAPALVDYVLVHELCHLKEMNHSRRFWAMVERHVPDCRALDKALRDGWEQVPRWAA
jgi:predicted metal-dependent hydrolase